LDIVDSDEGSTVDCETLISEHKDFYYSESEQEVIVDEERLKYSMKK